MSVESPELMIGLSTVLGLILFVPSLSVCVRRLHDTGRSGWWYLLILIPYVGGIALFIIFCLKSDDDNKYGPNPKDILVAKDIVDILEDRVLINSCNVCVYIRSRII